MDRALARRTGKVAPVFRCDRRTSKRNGASDQSEKWIPLTVRCSGVGPGSRYSVPIMLGGSDVRRCAARPGNHRRPRRAGRLLLRRLSEARPAPLQPATPASDAAGSRPMTRCSSSRCIRSTSSGSSRSCTSSTRIEGDLRGKSGRRPAGSCGHPRAAPGPRDPEASGPSARRAWRP